MKLLLVQISTSEAIAVPLSDNCIKILQESVAIRTDRNWDGIINNITRLDKNVSMNIIDESQILPPKPCKDAILKELEQKKQKLQTEIEELDKHVEEVSKL